MGSVLNTHLPEGLDMVWAEKDQTFLRRSGLGSSGGLARLQKEMMFEDGTALAFHLHDFLIVLASPRRPSGFIVQTRRLPWQALKEGADDSL